MCGRVKYTIRKRIEWATFWYVNQDHTINVCKDVAERKNKKGKKKERKQVIGLLTPSGGCIQAKSTTWKLLS